MRFGTADREHNVFLHARGGTEWGPSSGQDMIGSIGLMTNVQCMPRKAVNDLYNYLIRTSL